jgi:hypothetical protein
MLRFTTPDVLIVDDLGLRALVTDEPIDLYEIIRQPCRISVKIRQPPPRITSSRSEPTVAVQPSYAGAVS